MLSLDQPSSRAMLPRSRSGTNMSRMQNMNMTPRLRHKHIFIVTGPAGCGKTTVAKYLANRYSLKYLEGDDVSTFFIGMNYANKCLVSPN
jgi:gluconokinase